MDFKIFVNALLIILVLHLVIKNFPTKSFNLFGNKTEDTLNFLMDRSDYEHFDNASCNNKSSTYRELIDYVSKCTPSDVKPGNFYPTDFNSPNFTSNVLNVNKFYDQNLVPNYDGITDAQITPCNLPEKTGTSTTEKEVLEKVSQQTCFPSRNAKDNTEIFKPDNWKYRNELAMNGGEIMNSGFVGFDSLESAYASLGKTSEGFSPASCDPNDKYGCTVNFGDKPDDLRFGLGVPNKEYRSTN